MPSSRSRYSLASRTKKSSSPTDELMAAPGGVRATKLLEGRGKRGGGGGGRGEGGGEVQERRRGGTAMGPAGSPAALPPFLPSSLFPPPSSLSDHRPPHLADALLHADEHRPPDDTVPDVQ